MLLLIRSASAQRHPFRRVARTEFYTMNISTLVLSTTAFFFGIWFSAICSFWAQMQGKLIRIHGGTRRFARMLIVGVYILNVALLGKLCDWLIVSTFTPERLMWVIESVGSDIGLIFLTLLIGMVFGIPISIMDKWVLPPK